MVMKTKMIFIVLIIMKMLFIVEVEILVSDPLIEIDVFDNG